MSATLDVGYRPFHGRRKSHLFRWWVVARAAIVQSWKSKLLRWLTFISWAPLLYFSLYFFGIGQLTEAARNPDAEASPFAAFWVMFFEPTLFQDLLERPEAVRASLWTVAFYALLGFTQLLAILLVPALVGSGLIADDRRKGALMLYFSRPVRIVGLSVRKVCRDRVLHRGGQPVSTLRALRDKASLHHLQWRCSITPGRSSCEQ